MSNAVQTQTPAAPAWRLSLSELDYGPEEAAAVERVVRGGWLSMGAEVAAFEQDFAALAGTPHAVALSNGTAALHLAYLALGLGPGDEVIQPSINFIAAANMTRAVGASSVFADILGPHEPTLDPQDVERKLTPRTKAVVVMHYGGYCCRMNELAALCRQHGLALIEDACHAPGAAYFVPGQAPRPAGSLGDIACFSFFSNKNLATGEGGMVTTASDELAAAVRQRRSHGMTTVTLDRFRGHAFLYDVPMVGFNYRPTEITAALGRVQLGRLAAGNRRRRELIGLYRRLLADRLPEVLVPLADAPGQSAGHLMVVVLPDGAERQVVMARLKEQGVQSSVHYRAAHRMTAYQALPHGPLPRTEHYGDHALTLPLHPRLADDDVQLVVDALAAALRR